WTACGAWRMARPAGWWRLNRQATSSGAGPPTDASTGSTNRPKRCWPAPSRSRTYGCPMATEKKPVLHNYFRSSTSYRVRIALAMKGIEYDYVAHHLRHGGHHSADYRAINPQGLVPALI